nr:MAG TPA_asm: hypothetical protein [Caudoviricetes sp.]
MMKGIIILSNIPVSLLLLSKLLICLFTYIILFLLSKVNIFYF